MGGRKWTVAAAVLILLVISWPHTLQEDASVAGQGSLPYHDSSEIGSILQTLALEHPDVATFTTAQDLLGVRNITTGLKIPILLVGDLNETRPSSLIIGGHHGDEPDSAEAALGFAVYLLGEYSAKKINAVHIVERTNTVIMPVVNPWGLDRGIRYDENGEDPNRDYPFDPAPPGLYTDGVPLTTAGASAVHEMCRRYPFQASLSFHTGSFGIYTPWGANGVGNMTPDHVSFRDYGKVLSRASGWSIPYGPANDFPVVGYLTGAYDDHVYGASFLSDRLYDEDMILPWSTHTATVELIARKGKVSSGLGNLEGVEDPGGENDGTVPAGVRMCMAACELISPFFHAEVNETNETISVELRLIGSADPGEVVLNLRYPNGSLDDRVLTLVNSSEITPEFGYSFFVEKPKDNGTLSLEVSAMPDRCWGEYSFGGYPDISPRSLLSLSRGPVGSNSAITWTSVFPVENRPGPDPGSEPEPERGMFKLEPKYGYPYYAGTNFTVEVTTRPGEGEYVIGMKAEVHGTYPEYLKIDVFPSDNIHYTEIELSLPIKEGDAGLRLIIETNHYNYTLYYNFTVVVMPIIRDMPNTVEPFKVATFRANVDAEHFPRVLTYGISKMNYPKWEEKDHWLYGPAHLLVTNESSLYVDLPIPPISGRMYLAVTLDTGRVDQVKPFTSRTVARASEIPARLDRKGLVLGPAMVQYTGMETLEANGSDPKVIYRVFVQHEDGTIPIEGEMSWVPLSGMTEADIHVLSDLAAGWSLNITDLSGGWMLSAPLEGMPGLYTIKGKVSLSFEQEMVVWAGQNFSFMPEPTTGGSFSIEPEQEDGGERSTIAWVLLILTIVSAIGFLVVKIRNEAKNHIEAQQREHIDGTDERMGKQKIQKSPLERGDHGMKFK